MDVQAKSLKRIPRWEQLIFAGVLFVLFFIKCLHFYSLINVGHFEFPLAAATVFFIAVIYAAIVPFSPKAANVTAVSLYILLSVVMSVDLVYYNYMGKLPSAGLLTMAWQLGGVGGTIKELTGIKQLLPVLDIPLWVIFLAVRPFIKQYIPAKSAPRKLHVTASAALPILCVLIIASYVAFGSFKLQYLPNELLIFHGRDIGNVLSNGSGVDINASDYANGINKNSPFYGVANGKNVFVIQVEALQNFVIGKKYNGQEITPTLNSLIGNDSFYFNNYYYQIGGGNTADAEFAVNNSMYPAGDGASYEKYTDNDFYGLPWLLKDEGYTNLVFHANRGDYWSREKAYPGQGFDDFISIEDMVFYPNEGCVFATGDNKANTDRRLFADVLDHVKDVDGPFYAFTVTLSSHHPFSVALADRYVDGDNPSPNLFNLYIQSISYVDHVIGEFIDELKKEGLYEDSIFVIYGDHYAISQNEEKYKGQIEDLIGGEYDIFDRFNVPLIIHIPGVGTERTVETVGAHVDLMPTLLSLLGVQNNKSLMFGHNLLDPGYEGIVYEVAHVKEGSFITKDIFYVHSEGGINSKVYGKDGVILENKSEYMDKVEDALKALNDCYAILDSNSVLIEKAE
ncbi:MAG: LTA synthase family protein [Clostridia bacterium]|nr:LTA synthase family protein [Clostridia bacterium]